MRTQRTWTQFALRSLPILLAALMTGCVKNKILIRVKPDGTGNIVVTRIFAKEAVVMFEAQMAEMKKRMSAGDMPMGVELPEDPFYDEAALKKEAGTFGPGVTFVKAKKYEKNGRGAIALYAFEDINEVFVNMESMGPQAQAQVAMSPGTDEVVVAEKGQDAFEFRLSDGETEGKSLKIILPDIPEPEPEAEGAEADGESSSSELDQPAFGADGGPGADMQRQMMMGGGNPYGFTGQETQGEVMKRMLGGMEMSLSVEVVGTVLESTASHVDEAKKTRWTLFEIKMAELFESPKGASLLNPMAMGGMSSPSEFFGSLRDAPGVTLETQKEVNVVFK